ncbi:MAG: MlaD family protein [Actinomycetota bacterium]|nr:MlaD family protein [Actinomycetota bacterium]
MRRIVIGLSLVAVCALAVVGTGADDDGPKGKEIRIAFDNAFGLTTGGDLRVAGVRAGETTEFKTSRGPECQNEETKNLPARTCALVIAKITEDGYKSFRTDAQCDIRQQSLIGEYYVDCQPGDDPQEQPKGRPIPVQRTTSTVPTDLVNNVLRRPYRERFRLILAELGTGLAGRPQDLQEVLRRAHPGLRETRKVLQILGDQKEIIRDFIQDSDTVVGELDDKRREVARWIREAGETAAISASRRDAIAAGFQRLPTFLDELEPTMAELGELTDAQTPLLRDLQRAAPSLNEFLTRLGPFTEASRPAFRSLGETSQVGIRAFNESSEEIAELRRVASGARGLGKPLRQFLEQADNRAMAIDNDPRAAESAPPPPDKNAIANTPGPRKGFTTMEAVLNYIYWQTLAINQFDETSHILRTANFIIEDCSDFQNDLRTPEMGGTAEQDEIRKRCNSYLGPYQPGVTDPDPTDPDGGRLGFPEGQDGGAGETSPPPSSFRRTRPSKAGERRSAGDPAALPLPGQFDPSVPHVTLPPALQELVDELRNGGSDAAPSTPATEQMLDFLLAP